MVDEPAVRRLPAQVDAVCALLAQASVLTAAYDPAPHTPQLESSDVRDEPAVSRSSWQFDAVCALLVHCPVASESEYVESAQASQSPPALWMPCPTGQARAAHGVPIAEAAAFARASAHSEQSLPPCPAPHWHVASLPTSFVHK